MKKTFLTFAVMAGLSSFAVTVKAQQQALLISVNTDPNYPIGGIATGCTIGYTFQVGVNNLNVDALGLVNYGGTFAGLWDASGNLLVQSTFSGSYSGYPWNSISGVILQAGQQYTIGSVGSYGFSQNMYVGTARDLSGYVSIVGAGGGGGYTDPNIYKLTDPISPLPYGINGSGINEKI